MGPSGSLRGGRPRDPSNRQARRELSRRAAVVILWRAGLRTVKRSISPRPISTHHAARCWCVAARAAVGARSGWTRWAWSQLEAWIAVRRQLPVGALLCVIPRRNCWSPLGVLFGAQATGAHEGVPLVVIQRQVGHANPGVTSIDLQGIDSSEIIHTVHSRPAPVIPATVGPAHHALDESWTGGCRVNGSLPAQSETAGAGCRMPVRQRRQVFVGRREPARARHLHASSGHDDVAAPSRFKATAVSAWLNRGLTLRRPAAAHLVRPRRLMRSVRGRETTRWWGRCLHVSA